MSAALEAIEEGLREEILREVGRGRYRLWFRDAAVQGVGERGVTLAVPSEVHRTWLQYTYGDLLRRAAAHVLGDGAAVELVVCAAQGRVRALRESLPTRGVEWERLLESRRPKPTLSSFVADGGDRFAPLLLAQLVHGHGAVDPPAIYLYGAPGTGKTHLLTAVTDAIEAKSPGAAAYLTARRFTSRYAAAVRSHELGAVRAFEIDLSHRRVILVDDVGRLASRAATQAALVRLRERAVGTRTRIVLAGPRHPRDLEGFSSTLVSWLSSGVVLRLAVPDRARLVAILAARGRAYGQGAPAEDVVDQVLQRTGSVHGAVALVDRWGAASAELGRPLEAEWLGEIGPAVAQTAREEVVRRAKAAVAGHYGVAPRVLDAPTKARSAALPRRVAMYLVYRAAALPLKELGLAFGLKSHSSASRAIREIRAERERDPSLEQVIDALLARM